MSLQNHPNIIRELLLYFARFPQRSAVLERFRKRPVEDVNPLFTDYYATLKAEVEAFVSGEHSLCPAINDFVFASNEEALAKQIEDMDGRLYLFLDYGDFNRLEQATTNIKRKTDTFNMAVTVAMQWKTDDLDFAEHAALSDYTLNALRCVIKHMQDDNATCSGTKIAMQFPHNIVPFYARTLQNSTGWTLTFSLNQIDLI